MFHVTFKVYKEIGFSNLSPKHIKSYEFLYDRYLDTYPIIRLVLDNGYSYEIETTCFDYLNKHLFTLTLIVDNNTDLAYFMESLDNYFSSLPIQPILDDNLVDDCESEVMMTICNLHDSNDEYIALDEIEDLLYTNEIDYKVLCRMGKDRQQGAGWGIDAITLLVTTIGVAIQIYDFIKARKSPEHAIILERSTFNSLRVAIAARIDVPFNMLLLKNQYIYESQHHFYFSSPRGEVIAICDKKYRIIQLKVQED
jgi:hypothetical protein